MIFRIEMENWQLGNLEIKEKDEEKLELGKWKRN